MTALSCYMPMVEQAITISVGSDIAILVASFDDLHSFTSPFEVTESH